MAVAGSRGEVVLDNLEVLIGARCSCTQAQARTSDCIALV